jgi:two-component system, NarL family, response regulator NreC
MRVLLADDHDLVREGLRSLLEREGMQVVGEAASGLEALSLFQEKRPDVLIMDISMPDLNGIDATRQLLATASTAKIIGLSMNRDRRHVLSMLAAGASGYLLKTSASDELVRAIREVAAGRKYVSPAITSVVLDCVFEGPSNGTQAATASPLSSGGGRSLTAREREVLQLVAEGHSSKLISAKLNVAVATIETHRRQIMDKLQIRSVAELTKYAIREGLTSLQ